MKLTASRIAMLVMVFGVVVAIALCCWTGLTQKSLAAADAPAAADRLEEVCIVDLLARPDAYDGKRVRVEGFMHHEFEGTAIFMTKEHADYLMCKYGFWLAIDHVKYPAADFHGKYVLIEGTFNQAAKGHMGLWSGEIKDITRVMELTRFSDGAKSLKN